MKTSESVGKIAEALAKAQGQMKPAVFDAVNPFFKSKYATLTAIMDACRDALSKNGIAVVQGGSVADKKLTVTTMLVHSSGEFISDDLTMTITKDSPQDIGSALTYARRYSISSMVGIVSDNDDDGNSNKPDNKSVKVPSQKTQPKKVNKPEPPQAQRLHPISGAEIAGKIKAARKLLTDVGCKTLDDFNPLVSTMIGRELAKSESLNSLSAKELDTLISALEIQLKGE